MYMGTLTVLACLLLLEFLLVAFFRFDLTEILFGSRETICSLAEGVTTTGSEPLLHAYGFANKETI